MVGRLSMQNLLKYVSDILNIKTDSPYTIADMQEELESIRDITAYRHYIRDNIDHFDADYKTGFQKFIVLTRKYRALEYDATDGIEINRRAKELTAKVAACRTYIADTNGAFSTVKKTDGEYLFDADDIRIMRASGSAMYIIEASRCNTLEEQFRRVLKKEIQAKPYEQLPQRMANMIANTTKAIK